MGWRRRDWPEREPRPKVKKLSKDETAKILKRLNNGIEASPVLTALCFQVKLSRGRFYYEQVFPGSEYTEMVGRVTPLARPADEFLLEVEYGKNNWKHIKQGKVRTIVNAVSGDQRGSFHGLGILDKSIRTARKRQSDRMKVVKRDKSHFCYADSDRICSVQEALFHYFDVPIPVIAEPREWYAYGRTPYFRETSGDRKAALVQFAATSRHGDCFGGTCLYIKQEKDWSAYKIKPNQSDSIESSVQWLKKRKWVGW
ncbi:hypothetical protein ACFL3F_02105 [Planctomycetota bacterium]